MDAKTAQAQAAKAEVSEPTKTVKEEMKVMEKPVGMPILLGRIVTRMLEALQSSEANVRQSEIAAARRDLRIWYESQSAAERKEVVRSVRKTAENFKQVAEQIHVDIVSLILGEAL